MAVAEDVMVHLKQGSSTQREGRCGTGCRPKTACGPGTGGTEVAPDMKHSMDVEVIDGAGGRISG